MFPPHAPLPARLVLCLCAALLFETGAGAAFAQKAQTPRRLAADGHVEYLSGNTPVLLTAPHGGRIAPEEIPDRTSGVTVTDTHTDRLAREFHDAFVRKTARRPHVVICHLKRTKVDCNRPLEKATEGHPRAVSTWHAFHRFAETADAAIEKNFDHGLYIDLHAHGHDTQWLELGYLLRGRQLDQSDEAIEKLRRRSSLRALKPESSFAELMRGKHSFGALMQRRGYRTVPSPADPGPDGKKYFSGGYNTRRYGSRDGGSVSGFQLETPGSVRFKAEQRRAFADTLADAVIEYVRLHLEVDLTDPP